MRLLAAEVRKAATLPAVWVGFAVVLLGSVALTLINAIDTHRTWDAGELDPHLLASPFNLAFSMTPLGTLGAVVMGVVAFSSEYTANNADAGGGRQVLTTLIAAPNRGRLFVAKAGTLVLLVVAMAAATMSVTVGIAHAILGWAEPVAFGDAVLRCLAATLYWALSGLIAFAFTVLLRNGVVPLIVLIVNSSVVSVSFLLTKLTPLAYWLPDLAGRRLFVGVRTSEGGLGALPGGLVMTGWAVACCLGAAVLFARRDA
ncbi:hypothetical protein AB0E69_39315 [Kribbella sp. NPDC026611]|uniref:hypothetical protein n=1 Tax=Kribbella sp. NPDC026611 TaxID=3154911 RepID=UPI0033CCD581